jgi:hypothetical protein
MEKDRTSTIIIFFINGINSLLGWNAVLVSLDYFADSFVGYNIYSFLPVPCFIGYMIVGATFHVLSNSFRYATMIMVGNSIVSAALLCLLLVPLILDQTVFGFVLLLLCSLAIGIGVNLSNLVFYAMINYLS